MRPEVTITAPNQIFRSPTVFTASARDQNQSADTLRLDWFERDGEGCPRTLDEALGNHDLESLRTGRTFSFTPGRVGPFCVWVIATDNEGARNFAAVRVQAVNREPIAAIEVMQPDELRAAAATGAPKVGLYREIRLRSISKDEDVRDALEIRWSFVPPAGQTAAALTCAGPTPPKDQLCVRTDAPGEYRFELWARDEFTESKPASLTVTAGEDTPPCIKETLPQFETVPRISPQANELVTFSVLKVEDDGDPFPGAGDHASMSSFVWRVRRGTTGDFIRYTTPFSTFNIIPDGTYGPGDVVQVRVEYYDRVKDRDFSKCNAQATSCELAPRCFQWVSWTVVFR